MTVIAVATNTLFARSETFVTRHITDLNEGRTVAICRRIEHRGPLDRPVLVIGGRGASPLGRSMYLLRGLWNQIRWGGIAIPSRTMDYRISRFLQDHEVTAIVAEFGPLGCIIANAAEISRIPLFVHFHGQDASSLLERPGVRSAYRRLFPRLSGLFIVSEFLLANLHRHGLDHPNTHVIPSGVDTKLFAPGTKDPYLLLSVGRFVPKKCPQLVVRAFADVAAHHPVSLEMIGDGPLLMECKQLAAQLGLGDRIRFLGAQPHDLVRDRMAAAAILMQHSVTDPSGETEGLPTVIQEAMASGTVVVSTKHAGIPEAIRSSKNGLLVKEGDLDAFAKAVDRLLRDPAQTTAMAIKAREDAIACFDSSMLIGRMEAVIRQRIAHDERCEIGQA